MALSLPHNKKIEDQLPQLSVRKAGPTDNWGNLTMGQARAQQNLKVSGAAAPRPQMRFNAGAGLERIPQRLGEFGIGVGGALADIAQSPFRAIKSVEMSLNGQDDTFKPQSDYQKFFLGSEPVKNLEQTTREGVNTAETIATAKVDGNKVKFKEGELGNQLAPGAATAIGAVIAASDLTPFGGARRKAQRDVGQTLKDAANKTSENINSKAAQVIEDASRELSIGTRANPSNEGAKPKVTSKPPAYSVDPGINIPENVSKRLQDSGITGVRQKDNPYGAAYDPVTREIHLKDPSYATEYNLYHELGHDIFSNKLTPDEQALFSSAKGSASKQAAGRKGYTDTDITSEDFSDMLSRAMQGRLDEIPTQYRDVIAKYAGITEDVMVRSGQTPTKAADVLPRMKPKVTLKQPTERADLPGQDIAPADLPNVQLARLRQQVIERNQQRERPVQLRAETPPIVEQGNELPVGSALEAAANSGKEARKFADKFAESKVPTRLRVKDFLNNKLIDNTRYWQELDRIAAKSSGQKVRNVPAAERLDPLVQKSLATESQVRQRLKDLGVYDFGRNFSDQKTYDAYSVYRAFKTNFERATVNKKRNETIENAYARATGNRNLQEDMQFATRLDEENPEIGELFNREVQINRDVLNMRAADPNDTMSPELAELLQTKYPNYTRQGRETSEDIATFERGGRIGSSQGAPVDKLKEGSKTRPLADPMESLIDAATRNVVKAGRNKVSDRIVRSHSDKLRPMVTEDQLIAKENARIEMSELGDMGREFERLIKKDTRTARDLKKAIDSATQVKEKGKVTLKQDNKQVTVRIANMTDGQYSRLKANLAANGSRYDKLTGELDLMRQAVDDIKSAKVGIMNSGDLAAFEKNANKNVLRRVTNGREEIYEITDPRMMNAIDQLSAQDVSDFSKYAGLPVDFMKFMTTGPGNVVGFAPIAITRDLLSGILLSRAPKNAFFSGKAWGEAFKSSAMKGELFEELSRRGITGTMIEGNATGRKVRSNALRQQGVDRVTTSPKNPGQAVNDLEELEMGTERFSRARYAQAMFDKKYNEYVNTPGFTKEKAWDYAMDDAAEEYREAAINFSRGGTWIKEMNRYVAYLNPAIQGSNRVRRTALENPAGFAVRAGIVTSLAAGAYAYSNFDEKRREIYDRISPEDKRTNLILVHPWTEYNETTGAITGLTKVPIPYEFAPINESVNSVFAGAAAQDFGKLMLSGIGATTGLSTTSADAFMSQVMPTLGKPFVEQTANHSFFTGEDLTPEYVKDEAQSEGRGRIDESRSSTTGTAKALAEATGGAVNPIEADNYLRSILGGASKDVLALSDSILGTVGAISQDDVTSSDPFTRLRKRYTEAYGETDGAKFFDQLDVITKGIKDTDDKRAFELLHAKDPNPGILDSPEKAVVLLNRPEVYESEKKLDDWNRKQGKAGNPLFDLSEQERTVVLSLQANKGVNPGDKAMVDVIEKNNPWLEGYYEKQSQFFDKINDEALKNKEKRKKNGLPVKDTTTAEEAEQSQLGIKRPEVTDEMSKKFRAADALTDSKTKAQFYKDNPDLTEYLAANEEYNRAKRGYLGLPQLDKFPGNDEGKKLEEQFFTLPENDGPKGGDKTRSEFIKANPGLAEYWLKKNLWQMNEAAARNRYEGEEVDEEEAKDIMSVGKELGKLSGNGGFGGGKGGSGGSKAKALNSRAYAVSINAGGEIAKPKVTTKKGKAAPKKYTPRERNAKPKVTLKKSLV